jgi:polyisoprenyl-teichoic acid--peptidoglycan teichoic acid transferase
MSNERPWMRVVRVFLTVVITAGALYSGFFFVSTVRALVSHMDLPFAGRVQAAQPVDAQGQGDSPDLSADEPVVPEPATLDKRVNVLLLGIDERAGEAGPFRTDTMILVSLDPVSNSAAMLSIPRDLWTTIPGHGENRINTAHYAGDANAYPGGGPALAKKTVWYAFGVPVDNYVRINFAGFEQLVDAIGGLDIEVAEDIYDAKYPTADYGVEELYIPAGVHHMDGALALKYARTRHGSSDFARMARQQQVIKAAFSKALSLDIPITRIPKILALLGSSVQTDLNLQQLVTLANAARTLDPDNVNGAVIDGTITTTVVTPQGWMVEVADWDKVRALVDQLFPAEPVAVPPVASDPSENITDEGAKIAVYNGTLLPDLARQTAEFLRNKGYQIEGYNNADRFDHALTMLVVYRDNPVTVAALVDELQVDPETVVYRDEPDETIDIVVILGRDCTQRDWALAE